MAVVNAEEFMIKMNSNIAAVARRDNAVLGSLDASMAAAIRNLSALDRAAMKAAASSAAQAKAVQEAAAQVHKLSTASPDAFDAKALRAAKSRLGAEQQKLNALRAGEKALVGSSKAERAHFESIAKSAKGASTLGAAADRAAVAQKKSAGATGSVSSALQALGGPLAGFSGRIGGLAPLAELSATAIVGLGTAALAVALVAGAAAAAAALTRFGLAAVEARRQSMGLGEALSGVSRRPAKEFVAVVDQLAGQVPTARAQLQGLAQEMALLRLGGRDMQAAATAAAFTTAALGDSAGGAVKGIVQQSAAMRRFTLGARDMWGEFAGLAGTGLTKADVVGALAKQMGKSAPEVEKALILGRVKLKDGLRALEAAARSRFGNTVAGQMQSIGVQTDKMKERVGLMFRDISVKPLLAGLEEFGTLLDESTVSGKAFRFIFTTGTQAIVDGLGAGARTGGKFFQGMAIAALQAYIAIKPTYNSVRDFLGMKQKPEWLTAVNVGKVAFYALAGAVGVVAVSLALAALPFVLVGAAIYGLVEGVKWGAGAVLSAVGWVIASVNSVSAAFERLGWDGLAMAAIDALVGVFRNGASIVADAVGNLATSAANAFKSALGIASPSKLFGKFADWTVQGYVQQIEAGQPEAAEATAALGSGQPSVSVGGPTVNVAARGGEGDGRIVQIIVQGTGDPEAVADRVLAKLFGFGFLVPQETS